MARGDRIAAVAARWLGAEGLPRDRRTAPHRTESGRDDRSARHRRGAGAGGRPGAAPPLPRSIGATGTGWLIASALLLVWTIVAMTSEWARRVTDQVDSAILRQIARLRTDWLTDVMDAIDRVGSGWTVTVVGVGLSGRAHRGVPALAPPVHVPRRGAPDRARRRHSSTPTTRGRVRTT